MTAASAAPSLSDNPKNWTPLLEQAAREVFELMLGCTLTVAQVPPEEDLDITSMIGLAGQLCGLLNLQCSHQAAALMASKMLGIDVDKVDDEVFDAFGEIGNMVAGNFKNKIPGLGDGCMLSVPTVITGTDYSLHSTTASLAVELNLIFESMPIVISLQIST